MTARRAVHAVVTIAFAMALAAPTLAAGVKFRARRPGCDMQDGTIEVYNTDPTLYYHVKVEGGIGNAAGHEDCTVGGDPVASCVGAFSGSTQLLAPCHGTGFCKTWTALLTNTCQTCLTNCSAQSCDNRNTANSGCGGSCPATCGTSGEWCTTLTDLRVTIVDSSPSPHGPWTTVNQVIAAKGSYGSSPAPDESSYCTNHQALPSECTFNDLDLLCQYE
jgi:hypothetical protein